MKFKQYIDPIIADELARKGILPFEFDFTDIKDFLENPRMQFFSNSDHFKRFCACRGDEIEIIVELKDGMTCKIGTIDEDVPEIPEWEFHKKEGVA